MNDKRPAVGTARKIPRPCRFIQWTGSNLLDVIRFTGQHASAMDYKWDEYEDLVKEKGLKIFSLEGNEVIAIGAYIMEGIKGENWSIKEDIFIETYDVLPQPITNNQQQREI